MKKKIILYLSLLSILSSISFAQPQISWSRRFGVSTWDIPLVLNPDNLGNIYVAGTFGFTSNKDKPALIKYNISGDSLWSRIFRPPDSLASAGNALLMDDSSNIYISGRYILKYNPSGDLLYSREYYCSTLRSYFDKNNNIVYAGRNASGQSLIGPVLLKCNKNGDSLWKKVYPQFYAVESVKGVIVDKNNNIIFICRIYNSGNDRDFLTVKCDSAGNVIWYKIYHGGDPTNGYDDPSRVLLDSSDNIIVTGRSNGPDGGSNYYTVKYDPDGNVIWEARILDNGGSGSSDMKLDIEGNIYITGVTNSFQYSTIKYSSDGILMWDKTVDGIGLPPNSFLTLDTLGNVYVSCNLENNQSNSQYQVLKYDNNGNLIWSIIYTGNPISNYFSEGIAIDKLGNVFVTGEGQGNYYDFVTIRIDQTTGIIQNISETPRSFSLFQNYPNPFNPSTKINYELQNTNFVTLKVYDLNGKEITTIINKIQNAGSYTVEFNAEGLSSGIYFYTLNSGKFSETKRMVLIK